MRSYSRRSRRWTGFMSARNRFVRPRCFGVAAMLWCGWQLRRRKIDLAIDVRGDFPIALLIWLSGARRRLGWDCGGGCFLLTDSPAYLAGRPEVESRRALLAALGIHPAPGGFFSLGLAARSGPATGGRVAGNGWTKCRVGRAKRAPPGEFVREMVGLAAIDPPYRLIGRTLADCRPRGRRDGRQAVAGRPLAGAGRGWWSGWGHKSCWSAATGNV